jgi:hypothetical protein
LRRFPAPERNTLRAGLGDLIEHALSQSSETSLTGQWRLI